MSILYKQVFVFERQDNEIIIRYCCYESLSTGMFYVQNADFIRHPFTENTMPEFHTQSIELFTAEDISKRTEGFASLSDAIVNHKTQFS